MATYAGTYACRVGKMLAAPLEPTVWNCPVEAAQTFVAGEFVYRSGGYVVTCADDPQQILGIAKEDAPQVDGNVLVIVATAMTGFELPVHHTTPGTAVLVITDLDTSYQLAHVAATGKWYVDKDNTGSPSITIHQFVDELAVLNGLVIVTVDPGIREVA